MTIRQRIIAGALLVVTLVGSVVAGYLALTMPVPPCTGCLRGAR